MTKQIINVGRTPNDRNGDSLRLAFQKVNANFTELYTQLGLTDNSLNLGAFEFNGSVMTTTDSTPITIDQQVNITSDLVMSGAVVPSTTDIYDLGSPTKKWRSLYLTGSTVYFDGIPLSVADDGTIMVNGQVAATPGGSLTWNSITGKPTFATVATTGAYADLSGKPTLFSGSYADLTNKPTLFSGSYADLTNKPTLFSGSYADLTNKPNLAGTYQFSVAADDSTQRVISTDEVVKFVGAGGITTASDAEGRITITQGTTSSLVNSTKTVSLASTGVLSLPAQGPLYEVNQIASATINRTGASTDTAAIQDAWDNWYGAELTYRDIVDQDFQLSGYTWPWRNLPSWEGRPLLINYLSSGPGAPTPPFGTLPPNPSLSPAAQTAINAYLGYKELVSNIDIVSGNKAFTFENTGELSLPGTLVFKDTANAKIVLKTTDNYGYVLEPSEFDKAWTFNINGSLTFPNNTTQTTAFTGTGNIEFRNDTINDINGISITNASQTTASTASIAIPANGSDVVSIVNNAKTWGFDRDGALTIPGDIKSQGNINIDINLSDSTLRRWTFGEDGDLMTPNNLQIYKGAGSVNYIESTIIGGLDIVSKGLAQFKTTWDPQGVVPTGYTQPLSRRTTTSADLFGYNIGVVAPNFANWNWRFTPDGNLEIPGDIKSNNNINIDINPGDSTLRRWQFGEDGTFTVPNGISSFENFEIKINADDSTLQTFKFDSAGGITLPNSAQIRPSSATYDAALATWERARQSFEYQARDVGITAQMWPFIAWQANGENAAEYLAELTRAWQIQQQYPQVDPLVFVPPISASLYNEIRTALGIVNSAYLSADNGVSISVQSSDYLTLGKSWNFGEDGTLTLPSTGKISNSGYEWTFSDDGRLLLGADRGGIYANQSTGMITIGDGIGPNGAPTAPSTVIQIGGSTNAFAISAYGPPARSWSFGMDGRTTFPNGVVPEHSYGAAGDKEGMVVFTDPYIYYCKTDYSTSNGIASITISTPITRNDSLHWDPATTVIQFAVPLDYTNNPAGVAVPGGVAATGTPVFNGSGDLTGINIVSAGSGYLRVADGGKASITDIFIIQTGGTGGNSTREIRNGLPAGVTVTLTTTDIWVRVAWTGTNW